VSEVYSRYPTLRRIAGLSSSDTSNIFSIYLRQWKMPNVMSLYESTIVAHF
jgi:vacuolar-type H+-ATPase subunit C/Vma6